MRYVSERREQQTRASRVEHQTADPPGGLRPARKVPVVAGREHEYPADRQQYRTGHEKNRCHASHDLSLDPAGGRTPGWASVPE